MSVSETISALEVRALRARIGITISFRANNDPGRTTSDLDGALWPEKLRQLEEKRVHPTEVAIVVKLVKTENTMFLIWQRRT